MPELIGSMLPSLDQVMARGAEPRASQTSCVTSHSSTVSSDGGGPVMLDGTEGGGQTICVFCLSNQHCVKINYRCSAEYMLVHTDINKYSEASE